MDVGTFGGPAEGAAHNLTRVSHMLYRIIRLYNVTSMLDVPCTAHAAWMPTLLARLDFEVPAFRYACLDDGADVAAAADALTRASEGATVTGGVRFWEVAPLPAVDLVFSWAGLERQTLSRVFDFFYHVHRSGSRLALVGNHAGVDNAVVDPVGRRRHPPQRSAVARPVPPALNVRAAPFGFDAPARVIGGFALPPSPRVAAGAHLRARQKQLLLYRADRMRQLW